MAKIVKVGNSANREVRSLLTVSHSSDREHSFRRASWWNWDTKKHLG